MASAMAEAADTTAPGRPQTRLAASDVSARLQQVLALLFPSNLAAKAALFAAVVALLPLLPSSQQAPRIWELPHLLLLGIIISYGVFGQKNADAEVAASSVAADKPANDEAASVEAYVSEMMRGSLGFDQNDRDGDADGEGGGDRDGVQAWSSQYLPDDPLVVVTDTGGNDGNGGAGEKALHLPVRKLKPVAEESATLHGDIGAGGGIEEEEEDFLAPKAGDIGDGIEEEGEEEFFAPKTGAGYDGVREHAIPSPSSVLDADLTLSPSSPPLLPPPPPPPPPPPFLGRGRSLRKVKARSFNEFGVGGRSMGGRLGLQSLGNDNKQFRSKSVVQATRSTFAGYDSPVSIDGEAFDDGELDEMVAASESSFSSDMVTDGDDGNDKEANSYEEEEEEDDDEDDGNSCDEELFDLATRSGPEAEEVEDEVDRKADEFIAKFREQLIRMQRVDPARR